MYMYIYIYIYIRIYTFGGVKVYICFIWLQIELFDLMKKNEFLCKCIIIVLPTVFLLLNVSFFKLVGR